MALINKQKYNAAQLQKLADLVRISRDNGQAFDYEIVVDGLRVVRRTNDPNLFFLFENFVTPDTKAIEVVFYNGNSNVNERRMFTFGEDETENRGLNGIDLESRIQEQVEKQKKEWDYEQIAKQNKELKEEVQDLEKEVERLEKANEDFLNSQSPLKGFLGQVGSSFIESFIRRNPKILNGIPGGEALAGLLGKDETSNQDVAPEAEVTFQPKSNGSTTTLSEEDQAAITFVNQLKSQFTKDEFDKILLILQTLAIDKSKIDLILNHINIKQ